LLNATQLRRGRINDSLLRGRLEQVIYKILLALVYLRRSGRTAIFVGLRDSQNEIYAGNRPINRLQRLFCNKKLYKKPGEAGLWGNL
jgi:hypothetical protein